MWPGNHHSASLLARFWSVIDHAPRLREQQWEVPPPAESLVWPETGGTAVEPDVRQATEILWLLCLVSEPCLYIRGPPGRLVILLVYIDDVAIAASSATIAERFKQQLRSSIALTDGGPLSHFLGLKIALTRQHPFFESASPYNSWSVVRTP